MEAKLKELEEKGQKFIFLVERDNEIGTITSEISRIDITRLLAHMFYLCKKEDSKFILTVLCHTFGIKTTEKEKQEILASFFKRNIKLKEKWKQKKLIGIKSRLTHL